MTVASGTRLGPYEITEPLGAGGMGEVYKARDTRLDRHVAIKLLSPEAAGDAGRLARFEREARAASALNHPAIVTIYDVGAGDTHPWISMELVEGTTLRALLEAGPLPLKRVLSIAAQMADGLAKAHEAGIVHRDIKPENLMVTADGLVKILDFGLARLMMDEAASEADTRAPHAVDTRPGMVLGTLAYMSPQQASGAAVDFRSDQFSFGAVLYELLTGQQPFKRSSSVETLSAVLRDDPPAIGQTKASVPLPVRWIVERCLEKDPTERYSATRDLARDLATAREHLSELSTAVDAAATVARRGRRMGAREIVAWCLAVLLPFATAGWLVRSGSRPPTPVAASVRFALPGPESVRMQGNVAVSPNGRYIVVAALGNDGTQSLWVRAIDSLAWQRLTGTEGGSTPFWSPDGDTIGFFTQDKMKRVALNGGEVRTITDIASENIGAAWGKGDAILFGMQNGLHRVTAAGGTPARVDSRDAAAEAVDFWPSFLDDGRRYVFFRIAGERSGVYIGSLDSTDVIRLKELGLRDITSVGFVEPNYVLFVQGGTLLAQALNSDGTALVGDAMRVAEHINVDGPATHFSVSRNGLLVYRTSESDVSELKWVRRDGTSAGPVIARGAFSIFSLSPDGRHLAASRDDTSPVSLWTLDLERGSSRRLSFDDYSDVPVWSPDGTRMVFASARDSPPNLYAITLGDPSHAERLTRSTQVDFPTDWSPDGQHIAFMRVDPKTSVDVWVLPLSGDRVAKPLLNARYAEAGAVFSPNGQWLAYTSDETGRQEVYVTRFPAGGDHWPVSTTGGSNPAWSADGRELYFREHQKIMAVAVKPGPVFEASAPRSLFEVQGLPWESGSDRPSFDVAPDGRFLVNVIVERNSPPLTVVTDWRAGIGK